MPRKASVTPNKHLHTTIPADLAARLELYLYSEVEGRVPQGAYQEFVCRAIRNFFATRTINIGNLLEAGDTVHSVTATPETLALLTAKLQEADHA